jgi:cytochrome c oxidase assembly protein subunit 11
MGYRRAGVDLVPGCDVSGDKAVNDISSRDAANKRLALKLLWLVAAAVLFAFALVPLYNVFCDLTGLNGKTENLPSAVQKSMKVDESRWVTVEFTSSVMPGLAWNFYPKQASMRVHPGQVELALYVARNVTNETVAGQAVPSVSPAKATPYFKKIECFCFQRQELKPEESREMPLRFYVSPDIPEDVRTVTLSYAFYSAVPTAKEGGL